MDSGGDEESGVSGGDADDADGGGGTGGGDVSWFERWENRTTDEDTPNSAGDTTDEDTPNSAGDTTDEDTPNSAGDTTDEDGRDGVADENPGGAFRNEGGDAFEQRPHSATDTTRNTSNTPDTSNTRNTSNTHTNRDRTLSDRQSRDTSSKRVETVRDDHGTLGSSDTQNSVPAGDSREDRTLVGWVRWVARTDHSTVAFVRELLSSLAIVAAVGLILFAVSGIWPPMVAVESGSMTPHLHTGDLVFVMDEHRFPGNGAHADTGVVPYQVGRNTGYDKFHLPGDVIVYRAFGKQGTTPIIHRARFWVNKGENWYDEANPNYIGPATACETDSDPTTDTGLSNCPAPHAGFITKGDDNPEYDQVGEPIAGPPGIEGRISSPVKPAWVVGTAELRIPKLGCVRLFFSPNTPRACSL